jgi:hypothetical protein
VSAVFWALWKCRNRACFQNIFPVDPNIIIFLLFHVCCPSDPICRGKNSEANKWQRPRFCWKWRRRSLIETKAGDPWFGGWSEFVQKLFSSRRGLAKRKQFKSSQEERNKKFCSFCSCGTLMFVSKVVLFCFFVLVEVAVGGSVS